MLLSNYTNQQVLGFVPDIDQMETLGTQIKWKTVQNAESGTLLLAPETNGPGIHLHPNQEEEFIVYQGTLMVYLKDKWITLEAGDSLTIPKGIAHTYKNTSQEFTLFDFCLTPRTRFRNMLEDMDQYVQQQKIKGTDLASILYMCRVMAKFPDVTRSVKPPQFIVNLMAAISRIIQS